MPRLHLRWPVDVSFLALSTLEVPLGAVLQLDRPSPTTTTAWAGIELPIGESACNSGERCAVTDGDTLTARSRLDDEAGVELVER
jgi:hypothetical protein